MHKTIFVGATLVTAFLVLAAVGACGGRGTSGTGPEPTYIVADVGLYTGGWRGGPLDAGGEAEAADGGEVEPEAGEVATDEGEDVEAGEEETAGAAATSAEGPCPGGVGCGSVTTTSAYCGGAAPPPELLDELATPRPAPGMVLVVRRGRVFDPAVPETTRVTADAEGRFSFPADRGTYCLAITPKAEYFEQLAEASGGAPISIATDDPDVEPDCMTAWASACDGLVEIGRRGRDPVEINVARGCSANPCTPSIPLP